MTQGSQADWAKIEQDGAKAAAKDRRHDERLRLDCLRVIRTRERSGMGFDWELMQARQFYEEITGRKWQRTPQDAP